MLRFFPFSLIGRALRRFLLPALLTMVGGYWLFGSAVFEIVGHKARTAGERVTSALDEWVEHGRRRAFEAAQDRFGLVLDERRHVSRQIETLRRQRDQLAKELNFESSHINQADRVRLTAQSSDEDFKSIAQAEASLRRQRELCSRLRETDRMLANLSESLAEVDEGAADAWNVLHEQAFDLNRRSAWLSANSSYQESRRLLEDLPGYDRGLSGKRKAIND